MSARLPVAGPAAVRRATLALIRRDVRGFTALLALNALAALAGLAGPWLLGRIIDEVSAGAGTRTVDLLALAIVAGALAQLLLSRQARYVAHRFGERTSARVREQFADRALALPPAAVERAGTGDLTTRGTTDVAAVGTALRDAAPDVFVALVQIVFVVGAIIAVQPLLGACGMIGMAGVWSGARWYLRRARSGYLDEGAANSALAEVLAATASGARTVEALGLQERRAGGRGGRRAGWGPPPRGGAVARAPVVARG
ncbi:ABC transporter transmembrane domain-containing protein, partial [Kitasatospora sp. NPDC059571]|uniref:ABC transporter transmembrane domain-containing protein n=1 Tax=Kitasatospora sp. NPDC059571 TaxID=3346871 RepID=UPI0036B27DAF